MVKIWKSLFSDSLLDGSVPPGNSYNRYMPVITSRGCPYNCNFCFHPGSFRVRSPENVANEIELYIQRYNVDFVYFIDDLFMSSKRRVLSMCRELGERAFNLKFKIKGRINIVDQEILDALKDVGCVAIFYGAESADQEILDYMNKQISVQQIENAIRMTSNNEILVHTSAMLGQPPETRITAKKTIKMMAKLMDGHERFPRQLSAVTPYPGTKLYKEAVKEGKLLDEEDFLERFKSQNLRFVNLTKMSDEDYDNLLKEGWATLTSTWIEKRGQYLASQMVNSQIPVTILDCYEKELDMIKSRFHSDLLARVPIGTIKSECKNGSQFNIDKKRTQEVVRINKIEEASIWGSEKKARSLYEVLISCGVKIDRIIDDFVDGYFGEHKIQRFDEAIKSGNFFISLDNVDNKLHSVLIRLANSNYRCWIIE